MTCASDMALIRTSFSFLSAAGSFFVSAASAALIGSFGAPVGCLVATLRGFTCCPPEGCVL